MMMMLLCVCLCLSWQWVVTANREAPQDFYSLTAIDINGKNVSLESYRGKVSLVVNVASECGFTDKHYRGLVQMQGELGKTGKFNVLAFPSNQFGGQEPKTNKEILKFAKSTYSVNFPMFAKVDVTDSESIAVTWKFIGDTSGSPPNWNFWKYLIDPLGHVLTFWGPWSDINEIYQDVRDAVERAIHAKLPPSLITDPRQRMGDDIVGPAPPQPPPASPLRGAGPDREGGPPTREYVEAAMAGSAGSDGRPTEPLPPHLAHDYQKTTKLEL